MPLKQQIVDSPLGFLLMQLRSAYERSKAPTEALGTVANDELAERIVTALCAPGKTFLDVGAHIGSMIARVARHCPGASIQAFEAMPDKVEKLRAKFPSVQVHHCALAETEGSASFYVDLERSGFSSLARSTGRIQEIQVPLRTLDSILDSDGVDVIKIDVEGAELGVLRGASALLARSRPVVMFESGPAEMLGYTKTAMWQFFDERRYGVFVPNRLAHTAAPLTLDCFLDSHCYPRRTTNYFAVPAERFEEVRGRSRQILKLAA